jgi:hypothetical protein
MSCSADFLAAECRAHKEASTACHKYDFRVRFVHNLGTYFGPVLLVIGYVGSPALVPHPALKVAAFAAALAIGLPRLVPADFKERAASHHDSATKIAAFFSRADRDGVSDARVATFRGQFNPVYPVPDHTPIDWQSVDWRGTMACELMVFADTARN